jgi:hypothetical protein
VSAKSKAYKASKDAFFIITPRKLAKPTLKAGKKKITVKWKKTSGKVTGYQISYKLKAKKYKTVSIK